LLLLLLLLLPYCCWAWTSIRDVDLDPVPDMHHCCHCLLLHCWYRSPLRAMVLPVLYAMQR
jgi:hypothetical protein